MLAYIENGNVKKTSNLSIDEIPPHKRVNWKQVEGDAPTVDRRYYIVTGPTYQIEADRVLRVWQATARDLATVKIETKSRISAAAEEARCKYITPGSGKAMSYQQVAAEAIRYGATGGAGLYPFLQARVASGRYQDLATAAAAIQQIEAQWAAIGSAIDQAEDAAKLAIDAATTVEQVQAALQITWP
jgi:hypothetical protein